MKNTSKIQQFLKSQGVGSDTNKEEVERLKSLFWKGERVSLNREKRKKKKEVRFSVGVDEWRRLEDIAQEKNMTVTEYARKSVQRSVGGVYVPPNIPALEALKKDINNIGRNVNTAMQYMHLTRNYGESDSGLGRMREELNLLFRILQESVEEKPELYTWLQKDLETHPERVERVRVILQKLEDNASS